MYEQGEPHIAVPAENTKAPAIETAQELVTDGESSGALATAGWAVALGGMAAVSKYAEYKGLDHGMEAPERWVVDSAAHPLIGYLGVWAAGAAGRRNPVEVIKARTALLGATAANFAVEAAQSVTVVTSQYVEFWSSSNRMETGRDYAGALLGAAFFMWRDRRRGAS
jgi:hypothetical protein